MLRRSATWSAASAATAASAAFWDSRSSVIASLSARRDFQFALAAPGFYLRLDGISTLFAGIPMHRLLNLSPPKTMTHRLYAKHVKP